MFVHGEYFEGNKISDYGLEHGRVDYRTFSKAFDAVLNNEVMQKTYDVGYWEQESGMVDNTEEIEELEEEIEELREQIEELEEQTEELEEQIEELEDSDEENKDNNKAIKKIEEEIKELKNKIEELENKAEKLEEEVEELENEQDYPDEIFQYYIVSDYGAELLKEINEIIFYNEELDMYVWGVTHYGTSWDYVLTNIRCNVPYDNE